MTSTNATTKTPSALGDPVEFFTQEQLETTAIRDLYLQLCEKHFQTPSQKLLQQLPIAPEDVDDVVSLDFSGSYFGSKGLPTILPVIDACHRVVHVNLTGVGLEGGSTMLNLLTVLKNHRGVRDLVLSKNKLGTESILKLIHIAYSRCLLYKVDLEETWIVEPLKSRLQKILDNNSRQRDQFPRPGRRFEQKPAFDLINDVPTPPPEIDPVDRPIVPQVGRILAQLREAVVRHRTSLPDLQSMFKPLVPGVCSAKSFMRVVKLLDISQVENEFSLHELSDIFGTTIFVEGERVFKYGRILAALRDHCELVSLHQENAAHKEKGDDDDDDENNNEDEQENLVNVIPIATRDLFDHIFDSRNSIIESCEMIDIDSTGNIMFDDFVAGISAATQTNRIETEKLIRYWFDKLFSKEGSNNNNCNKLNSLSQIPYKIMLNSLQLKSNNLLPVSGPGWEQWSARLLRCQA